MGKLSELNEMLHELWIEDNLEFEKKSIIVDRTEDVENVLMGDGDYHKIIWSVFPKEHKLVRMQHVRTKLPDGRIHLGWLKTHEKRLSSKGILKWKRALEILVSHNRLY